MKSLTQGYKRYALILLTAVYTLSFMDRIMIGILMESMKQELHLSDTQLGFLTGLAFALFYATLGIPIARWADRGNRVTIASLAIGMWGVMMMMTGFVTHFFQLMLVRIGAAVGEAGVFPPAYSLLGDYFETHERNRAFAIYMAGISISIIVSYLFAGWINEYYGWRMAFFVVSVFGLIAAVLIRMTLLEPRKSERPENSARHEQIPFWETVRILWRIETYRYLVLAFTLANVVGIGFGQWEAVFFIRRYEMGTGELGVWLGLIMGFGGLLGTWFGGYIADRFYSRNLRGLLNLIAIGVALVFPCAVVMVLSGHKLISLWSLVFMNVLLLFFYGPTVALMQRLVHDRMRSIAAAFSALILNLVAMGLGPQFVGLLSDVLTPALGAEGLPVAMVVVATAAFGATYCFWRAGKCVDDDLAARQRNEEPVQKHDDNIKAKKIDALAGQVT